MCAELLTHFSLLCLHKGKLDRASAPQRLYILPKGHSTKHALLYLSDVDLSTRTRYSDSICTTNDCIFKLLLTYSQLVIFMKWFGVGHTYSVIN